MKSPLRILSPYIRLFSVAAFVACWGLSHGSTLTNGLLVHLTFDGDFTDDSGNQINGTAVGNPLFVPGFIGSGAVSLTTSKDASEIDYVTLGYPQQLMFDTSNSLSVSFWTSYTNQYDDPPFISNKNWESSGNQGWGIFTQNNGNFRVNVTDENGSAGKESTTATPIIRDGKWHHIAVTFDRGTAQLVSIYVDGILVDSDSLANVTGDIDTVSDGLNVNIGQDGTGGYTDGGNAQMVGLMMDDMGIWGRVLSDPEVVAIYQGGLLGSNIVQVVTKLNPIAGDLIPTPNAVGVAALPGISSTITDKDTAVVASTVTLFLDGTKVGASVNQTGNTTLVSYTVSNLLAPNSIHTVTLSYGDNNVPADQITTNWSFTVLNYPTIPASAAQPSGAVSTSSPGFQMRVSQINDQTIIANDGTYAGSLPGCVARAEAQLAGLLVDPMTGQPQQESATAGSLANGAYPIAGVLNFSTFGSDQGDFNSANGHPLSAIPGQNGIDEDNLAIEFITYLYLPAGFYQFGANSADGFRMTIGTNAYDVFSTQVGLYDTRSIPRDTTFGFAVSQTGYYAARIVWFRQAPLPDNNGSAGFELFTVTPSGQKVLVNDSSNPQALMAYQSSSASYSPYVKYAGPTSFISPYPGNDWGSPNIQVQIQDGSSAKVTTSSVQLSVDGSLVSATASSANGVTTVSYTPAGLQLRRTPHTGKVIYSAGGTTYTNTWQFNSLRSYVLPAPLYFENFDELADGQLPPGWSQTNYTTPEEPAGTISFTDYNSSSFLGWTVMNAGDGQWGDWPQHLNVGLYQELNGLFFDANTNALLVNQFLYAESDNRSGQQIQYVYTTNYNLSGKTGIVVAYDSSYEQNQNNIDGLEYSLDGINWQPVVYFLMGDDDSQQMPQIIHDADGTLDVAKTMAFGISPHYTNSSGVVIGGSVGAFIGPAITQELAPYIEDRVNDDSYESMRFEAWQVPGADNQPTVQFRFFQVGTGSWFWGIDNWGIYSVPSLVNSSGIGSITAQTVSNTNLVLTWTAGSKVSLQQNTNLSTTNWTTVAGTQGAGTFTVTNIPGKPSIYYRLAQ